MHERRPPRPPRGPDGGDERITVLHIMDVLALAGMEHGVIKLVNRLPRDRFRPIIACLRFQADSTRALLDPSVPVIELHRRPGRNLSIALRLARIMRQERVDVVHSHNWPTFFYTAMGCLMARPPVFLHGEHGHEDPNAPLRHLGIKRSLSRVPTRLLTVSHGLTAELTQRWRVPPERINDIPNGVDLARFGAPGDPEPARAAMGLTAGDLVVMNIGSHRPVKDHETLLRAFARAHARHPAARLVLVGKGEWDPFLAEADRLGVADAIRLPGIRHDVPELLSLADVYVNSSVFEGMSNTILEAMAARRPVIATNVGGNPQLVRDQETGYLVPVRDDATMGERLARLLGDAGLRDEMGAAGRRRVERHHSIEEMVGAYRDVYEETVARRRLRRAGPFRETVRRGGARAIRAAGLVALRSRLDRGHLTILNYHRVLPLHEAERYPFPGMVMPRDIFEAQIAHLARHYRVLPFSDAARLLAQGSLPRRTVVVTFDDGYRDNYEHAWPILRKYAVPAMLFVVTGVLDGRLRLWWDDVAEVTARLERARPTRLPDGIPAWAADLLTAPPGHRNGDAGVAASLVRRMNEIGRDERLRLLGSLRDLAGVRSDPAGLMLTWDEVREMHAEGLEIGGHTVSHVFLDELDDATGLYEIRECLGRIRAELREATHFFSYPRGRVGPNARRLLESEGIRVAVTTEAAINPPDAALLQLHRFDAGYARLHAGFDPVVFDVEVQGWFQALRR